jgi:hypothetical protein
LPSACCFCSIKESFISQTLNAFDFAEVRSKKDRELLYEAKYGERGPDVSERQAHCDSHKKDSTTNDRAYTVCCMICEHCCVVMECVCTSRLVAILIDVN